jgi:hypothetical protein
MPPLQVKAKKPFLLPITFGTLTEDSDNETEFLRILTNFKF